MTLNFHTGMFHYCELLDDPINNKMAITANCFRAISVVVGLHSLQFKGFGRTTEINEYIDQMTTVKRFNTNKKNITAQSCYVV